MYPGKDQGSSVTGHTDAAVTVGSWSIADNTATFDIAADANIQKGRYMVSLHAANAAGSRPNGTKQRFSKADPRSAGDPIVPSASLLQVAVRPTNYKLVNGASGGHPGRAKRHCANQSDRQRCTGEEKHSSHVSHSHSWGNGEMGKENAAAAATIAARHWFC